MTMTADEIKARVEQAMTAALQYFLVAKNLPFKEFESDLGPFLEAYLKQIPDYKRMSYKLHPFPDGDRFDIGLVFENFYIASQLFEVESGISTKTTFH